jgi:aminoglycoside phosphotransferase (APT) family kinase protein
MASGKDTGAAAKTMPQAARRWICEVLEVPHAEVTVRSYIARPAADIYICDVQDGGHARQVCLKTFKETEDAPIATLLKRAQAFQPALSRLGIDTPHLLACNEELSSVVMTVVTGKPFEDLVTDSIRHGTPGTDAILEYTGTIATTTARIHQLDIPDDVPLPSPCSNREYVQRLDDVATSSFVDGCVSSALGDPRRLRESLQADFWTRHEKRVLHGDCQPKNFLFAATGEIIVMDLSYGRGHPLHDIAHFLVQLDRIHWRLPLPRTRRLLKLIERTFLARYEQHGLDYLMDDLPFFEQWAMTFSLLKDERHSWLARQYIRAILGRSVLFP